MMTSAPFFFPSALLSLSLSLSSHKQTACLKDGSAKAISIEGSDWQVHAKRERERKRILLLFVSDFCCCCCCRTDMEINPKMIGFQTLHDSHSPVSPPLIIRDRHEKASLVGT